MVTSGAGDAGAPLAQAGPSAWRGTGGERPRPGRAMASTGSPLVSPGVGGGPRARRAMVSTGSPLVSPPGAAARGVLGE